MLTRAVGSFRQVALAGGLAVAWALLGAGSAHAAWESPQAIDNGAGYGATEPSQTALAVGPNGLATILFFQAPSTPSGAPATPFMVRRPAETSTSWSAPASVATPGGQAAGAPNPALAGSAGGALGPGGSLALFGFQPSSGNTGVVSTAWPASGSAPVASTGALCTSATPPECASDTASPAQIALDGAGNGYAVAEATGAGFGDILFARTDPSTGGWQPAQVVAKNSELPLIAVDPGGDVVVSYAKQDTSTPGLYDYHEYIVRELAGQPSFSAPAQISGPDSIYALPGRLALVIDPSATATAAFLEDTVPPTVLAPSAPVVQAVRWPLGATTPSAEQQISASGVSGGQPTDVTLAVDPAGRVTAGWDAMSPSSTAFAAQFLGGTWGAPQQLSPSNGRSTTGVQVAADAAGTVTLVYADAAAGNSDADVKATRLPVGGTWSAPVSLRSTDPNAGAVSNGIPPHVVAGKAGQADVTFVQALSGTNRLFATRFDDTTPPSIQIVLPQDGATYRQGTTVLAGYSCADEPGGSGLASCAGTVAEGQPVDTSSPGTRAFTVNASDQAGNSSSKTVHYTVQAGPRPTDTTPPRITINAPRNGALYAQEQRVYARFSCSDPDSPVALCRGTVGSGHLIDTRALGRQSFSVIARDPAGNTASTTVHYAVGRFSCAVPSGRLAGLSLGKLRLGMKRTRARHLFARWSTEGRRYMDFFCLNPIGIRAGYPSPVLLRTLSGKERRSIQGRVVLVLTGNRYYALHGVRAGTRLANVARRLRIGRRYKIGLNVWYLPPDGRSRGVLMVRRGIIQEIGIASKQLTNNPRAALRFLRSFS